jgi:thioester reductase-like protein
MNYFITGSTGFVGSYVMRELLKSDPNNQIKIIVRPDKGLSGYVKANKIFQSIFTPEEYARYKNRIEIFEGNFAEKKFGLSNEKYDHLTKITNVIFHSAATIKFNLSLEEATRINVDGTNEVMQFAEKCFNNNVLKKVNHISTAYITGRQKGNIENSNYKNFSNTYEITKYEGEKLVNGYIDKGLPVTIFRPSIITGNSTTGEITTNNLIYSFALLLTTGRLNELPCNDDTSLNIISINYFIDLMFLITKKPESLGRTFNITNNKNTNLKSLIEFSCNELGIGLPKFIHIKNCANINKHINAFIPYFEESHFFDLTETYKILNTDCLPKDDILACTKKILEYSLNKKILKIRDSVMKN